jgi:hypothetical protein
MSRVVLAVDAGVGITAQEFVVAWGQDEQASAAGPVRAELAGGQVFVPGLVEWVVLPLAVNLASSVLYDVVKRVLGRARSGKTSEPTEPTEATEATEATEVSEVEVREFTTAAGDRLVVVRSRREVS